MRRRDRHLVLVLAGMLFLQVATSAVAVAGIWVYRRRFRAVSEDLATSIKVSEKASRDAAANALLLVDMMKDGGYTVDQDKPAPPVVVGYGQTRSKGAVYIYRDVRDPDGIVTREFVQRIPFKAK